jgi:hypothetical protein
MQGIKSPANAGLNIKYTYIEPNNWKSVGGAHLWISLSQWPDNDIRVSFHFSSFLSTTMEDSP